MSDQSSEESKAKGTMVSSFRQLSPQERQSFWTILVLFAGTLSLFLLQAHRSPWGLKGSYDIHSSGLSVIGSAIETGSFPEGIVVSPEANLAVSAMASQSWSLRGTGIPSELNDESADKAVSYVQVTSRGETAKFLVTHRRTGGAYRVSRIELAQNDDGRGK